MKKLSPFLLVIPLSITASAAVAQQRPGFGYVQPAPGGYGYTPYQRTYGYYPGVGGNGFGYTPPPASYMPTPLPGGNYAINGGALTGNFWRAPSGYYYPWVNTAGFGSTTYYAPQTNQPATAQAPPLSTVFGDLLKYLEEKKEKKLIANSDYEHLRRRATDLQTKYFSLRTAGDGTIDPADENSIRKDIDELSAEVTKAVKSNPV